MCKNFINGMLSILKPTKCSKKSKIRRILASKLWSIKLNKGKKYKEIKGISFGRFLNEKKFE
jgi:hypothetical protein